MSLKYSHDRASVCRRSFVHILKLIKLKFYVEPPWVGGMKVCSRDFSLDPMPFKLILKWFFSEIMWPIKMIFYVEPFWVVALIFCSLYLGQMTHPNMVKTLQKSSPEPMGRFTRNLVCSIEDSSPS